MKSFCTSTTGQLSMGLLLVISVFVAFAIGGDVGNGAICAAVVLAFLLLVLYGRRRCAIFGLTFIGAVGVLARRS